MPEFDVDCTGISEEDVLREVVLSVYNIKRDDAALRKICDLAEKDRGIHFEKLRREYPLRREFFNARVTLRNLTRGVEKKLKALGFEVD